jgi:two-component system, sensor histidine kinase and response regulator
MKTTHKIGTFSTVSHTGGHWLSRKRRTRSSKPDARTSHHMSRESLPEAPSYRPDGSTLILRGATEALNLVMETQDFREGVQAALGLLGSRLDVSRIRVFRSLTTDRPGAIEHSLSFSWSHEQLLPQTAGSRIAIAAQVEMLPRWLQLLKLGKHVQGSGRSLPTAEQTYLENGDTLSVLLFPITIGNIYWGFAELDSCRAERMWTDTEIAALRTAGGMLARAAACVFAGQQLRRSIQRMEAAKSSAEAAAKSKSEFLAAMSHEIRTPMGGILGMTELALGTQLSIDQRNYIQTAKTSAENLLHILNDVLDFSKIEAGRIEIEHSPFLLRETIGATLKTFAIAAFHKGLELTCHIDPTIPPRIIGDGYRLTQVLSNLINNAVKFTQSGEVGVSVDQVRTTEERIEVHFAVRDTGIGIDEKDLGSVFTPFCQGDRSTARLFGGTGLGLTISSGLVSMMGGTLEVASTVGVGSSFHFVLPFTISSAAANDESAHTVRALAGTRALISCSNMTTLTGILTILRAWGMETHVALDAQQIVAELRKGSESGSPHDLLLMDAAIPGSTRCIQTIRQTAGHENLPIIALTRGAKEAEDLALDDAGVTAVLNKPFVSPDLLAVLRRIRERATLPPEQPSPSTFGACPPARRQFRILLAEDHPVNQLLAVELLKQMGHTVTLARDGREAVETYKAAPFDVVLLDIQMPVLDGFGAADAIRRHDAERGTHTPLVALTAHAMEGYREQCLAAGMDDYVTKPIDSDRLRRVIDRLGSCGHEPVQPTPAVRHTVHSGDRQVFHRERLLEQCNGSDQLVNRLIMKFLETAPAHLQGIQEALGRNDAGALQKAAHTLKGAAGSICAEQIAEHLRQLELSAKEHRFQDAQRLSVMVNEEFAGLEAVIKQPEQRTGSEVV